MTTSVDRPSTDVRPSAEARRAVRWRGVAVAACAVLVLVLGGGGLATWLQGRPPAETSAEVGFTLDMYAHHQQAVTMAMLVREKTTDPEIDTLAYEIVTGQAEEMGMFLQWSREREVPPVSDTWRSMVWMSGSAGGEHQGHGDAAAPGSAGTSAGGAASGGMASMGMASDAELSRLGRLSGEAAEVLFLQLMLRHHIGGLEMAQAYLDRGDDEWLSTMARAILTSQEYQNRQMRTMLSDRGAAPLPG